MTADGTSRRILHVSDFYTPFIGGMERHVENLCKELALRGHRMSVVTSRLPGTAAVERSGDVTVYRVDGWARHLSRWYGDASAPYPPPVPDPGVMRELDRILLVEKPDIVHGHGWMTASALQSKRALSARTAVTLHDYGIDCAKKTRLYRDDRECHSSSVTRCLGCAPRHYGGLKGVGLTLGLRASRSAFVRAERYVAVSSAVAEAARSTLAPRHEVQVIPTFIRDVQDQRTRPAWLPAEDGYLMFVGALGHHKGIDVLLDAYGRLPRPVPLVVVGTKQADTPLAWPPGVIVRTDVAHDEVMAAWRHAGLALVPSIWPEPFGQVAIEAMAVGTPVIASRIGGLVDALDDGAAGVLVPPGDAPALAEAITALQSDPSRRDALAVHAREHAAQFTVKAVATRHERLYDELCAAPRT